MKRTLAITLTVAMIGSLMFMGFAGTAAAQNADDGLVDIEVGDQTTGDATATTDISVDQENNNAQVGVADATAGDAVAISDGGNGGEALATSHDKGGAEQLASPADSGAATALSVANAEVNQAQDVNQQNAAEVSDVTTTAESGDNTAVEVNVDLGDALDGDADAEA